VSSNKARGATGIPSEWRAPPTLFRFPILIDQDAPSVGATTISVCEEARMATDAPTIRNSAPGSRHVGNSLIRALLRQAADGENSLLDRERFSIKSNAPSFVARTAVSILPWPEIITTSAQIPSKKLFQSFKSINPRQPDVEQNAAITRAAERFETISPVETAQRQSLVLHYGTECFANPRSSSTMRIGP